VWPAGFSPDSTTVFSKKGDLLQLGELVLPADAQLKVNQSQVSGTGIWVAGQRCWYCRRQSPGLVSRGSAGLRDQARGQGASEFLRQEGSCCQKGSPV
jgi:hypothetical protein